VDNPQEWWVLELVAQSSVYPVGDQQGIPAGPLDLGSGSVGMIGLALGKV
jgi:hypothetical protein